MGINITSQFTQINLPWTTWKVYRSKKELVHQYVEDSEKYLIWGYDSPEVYICTIYKSGVIQEVIDSGYTQQQNDLDKTDFETNYKSKSNLKITGTQPFNKKVIGGGSKIFRRKHGSGVVIPANSSENISITIPYVFCKIDRAEIVGCEVGDIVNFKVYDNSIGSISTIPNYMLNQFGFNVQMPSGFYVDESKYDADLIMGMKIEIAYTNNSSSDKYVGVNFTLHEII